MNRGACHVDPRVDALEAFDRGFGDPWNIGLQGRVGFHINRPPTATRST